ncbi:MAG: HYR domain-containing protein, partial [Myxococcota bacterium]
NGCGVSPSFAIDVNLQECDNEIQVTAVDLLGNQASVKTVIRKTRFDAEPPVISGVSDISVDLAEGEADAKVEFGLTAVDNCDAAVPVHYDPASGLFYPAGDTEIGFEAHDVCGNSSTGTFTVSINEFVAPEPEPIPEPEPTPEPTPEPEPIPEPEPTLEPTPELEPIPEPPADDDEKVKHDNRSGLGDGTNPGLGKGRANSPNQGTENPNEADRREGGSGKGGRTRK